MNKQEARRIYRDAWTEYAFAIDEGRQKELEAIMDLVQDKCVTRNEKLCVPRGEHNPALVEWKSFSSTLPGYVEFWGMLDEECDRLVQLVRERTEEAAG